MKWLSELFGRNGTLASATPTPKAAASPFLWDATAAPPQDDQLLESLLPVLPKILERVSPRQLDPVVLFVNLENMKWRGLLRLICDKPNCLYFSPEQLTGQPVRTESSQGVLLYQSPSIDGKQVRIGIYTVKREQVVYALCGIQGIPIPLIKQVQAVPPSDRYTVAFFGMRQLGVRHVSRDAATIENAPFVF